MTRFIREDEHVGGIFVHLQPVCGTCNLVTFKCRAGQLQRSGKGQWEYGLNICTHLLPCIPHPSSIPNEALGLPEVCRHLVGELFQVKFRALLDEKAKIRQVISTQHALPSSGRRYGTLQRSSGQCVHQCTSVLQ